MSLQVEIYKDFGKFIVEDQVRIEGKNANDFVAELEQKGNEANKAALEAAKEAYAMIGIELNY